MRRLRLSEIKVSPRATQLPGGVSSVYADAAGAQLLPGSALMSTAVEQQVPALLSDCGI